MTPALRAMVEAMGREFERQAEGTLSSYAVLDPTGQGRPILTVGEDGGLFDLEKVARAGLEASGLVPALQPFASLGAALPEHYPHDSRFHGPGHPRFWYEIDPAHIWAAREALDAILKEQP